MWLPSNLGEQFKEPGTSVCLVTIYTRGRRRDWKRSTPILVNARHSVDTIMWLYQSLWITQYLSVNEGSTFFPCEGLGTPLGDPPDVLKPNQVTFLYRFKVTRGLDLWDFPMIYTLCNRLLKALLGRASARECQQCPRVWLFSFVVFFINWAQQIQATSDKFNLSLTLVVKKI